MTIQYISLLSCNWRNCISANCHRLSSLKKKKKKVTAFPILYYKCDYNAAGHNNCVTIHSWVYRWGYREAIRSITPGYHKATVSLLRIITPLTKHEFLLALSSHFWSLELVMWVTPTVFCITRQHWCSHWWTLHLVSRRSKFTVATRYDTECIFLLWFS